VIGYSPIAQGCVLEHHQGRRRDYDGAVQQRGEEVRRMVYEDDDEAKSVLRSIWSAQRQSGTDIGRSTGKVCRNMKNIGFGGLSEGGAEGESTAGPVDDDQRSAWRERLEREGKVAPGSTSLREVLLGSAETGR
jgi:hypothetical protein